MFIATLILASSQSAFAINGSSIEAGHGEETTMLRLTSHWDWDKHWNWGEYWTGTGQWEAGLSSWHGIRGRVGNIWEAEVTPIARLYSNQSSFFWEGGVGVHLMSNKIISGRDLGKHYIFGIPVGLGWQFGINNQYELGVSYQHLSNADTSSHNAAINFG